MNLVDLQPIYEAGRSYAVKGDLLNRLIRTMRLIAPIPGPGILIDETPEGRRVKLASGTGADLNVAVQDTQTMLGGGIEYGPSSGPVVVLYIRDGRIYTDPAAVAIPDDAAGEAGSVYPRLILLTTTGGPLHPPMEPDP
jgi:hypothetical protein